MEGKLFFLKMQMFWVGGWNKVYLGNIRIGDGSLGYSLFSRVHRYDFIGIWFVISSRDFHTR